jgi:hypothetical protein
MSKLPIKLHSIFDLVSAYNEEVLVIWRIYEKLTDGRRTLSGDNSSHDPFGSGELKSEDCTVNGIVSSESESKWRDQLFNYKQIWWVM